MALSDEEILRIARIVLIQTTRRFHSHDPAERDEIRSDALLGIAKALRDHDHSDVPVAAYALIRARGEVLDGIRHRSPLSRGDHARGLTVATIPAQRRPPVSLEQPSGSDIDTPDRTAERSYSQVEDCLYLTDLLTILSPQQRAAVTAYFWEAQRMWEIADAMGVTESRVSQIIAGSLKALRREAVA